MKKYEVILTAIEKYKLEVEAENETSAISKAWEMLAKEDKDRYFFDADGDADAWELR